VSQTSYPIGLLAKQVVKRQNLRWALKVAQMVVLAVMLTACFVLVVWTRQLVVQTGYAIQAESELGKELAYRNEDLGGQLEMLRSPGRLARKADQLGMSAPGSDQVIRVNK